MRRMWMLGLLLATMILAGCSDDNGDEDVGDGRGAGDQSAAANAIDVVEAESRLETVCNRSVSEALVEDCMSAAQAAVAEAVVAECPAPTLDAWAEHIVATEFESVPRADFFENCPVPLSNMLLPSVPAPYQRVTGQRGTGLLDRGAVAAGFVAADEVASFLAEIDHQVSYAAAFADGDRVVLVRLDRFADPDGARAFLDSESRALSQDAEGEDEIRDIAGIDQGRVVSQDSLHLATGRSCEVVMTLIVQGSEAVDADRDSGADLTTDEVIDWFSDQARRVQTAVSC